MTTTDPIQEPQPNPFHQGLLRLSYRKVFMGKQNGKALQYVALTVNSRLLHTPDMNEQDAVTICRLFNETVVRNVARRRKEKVRQA